MTYSVKFRKSAFREWKKLDPTVQRQFAKKLKERIENPRVEADHLRGMKDCYKIKLKALGYMLVYEVQDTVLVISVVAVGKRNRSEVYELSSERLK